MGNTYDTIGRFEWGHLIVAMDTPFVYAGAELTGTVHMRLDLMYPAGMVEILIRGQEKMIYKDRESGFKKDAQGRDVAALIDVVRRERRDIINFRVPIYTFA
jgi:hypothetical protein